jgi:hypothetical protein
MAITTVKPPKLKINQTTLEWAEFLYEQYLKSKRLYASKVESKIVMATNHDKSNS